MKFLGRLLLFLAITVAGIYCLPQGPEKLEYIAFKLFGVNLTLSPEQPASSAGHSTMEESENYEDEAIEDTSTTQVKRPEYHAGRGSKLHSNRAAVKNLIGDNYLDAVLSAGKLERWNPKSFPLRVYLQGASGVPSVYVQEVKNAFSTWEKHTNGFVRFVYTNSPSDAHYKCIFASDLKNRNCDEKGSGTAAYQYFTYDTKGNIKHSVVEFSPFACGGHKWPAEIFYSFALHEIGHGLGLRGHSTNPDDLMYPVSDGEIKRAKISQADMTTLRAIYSIIPDTSNIPFSEADKEGLITTADLWGNDSQRADFTIRQIQENIKITPDNPSLYIELARACQEKKYYQGAIDAYSNALKRIDNKEHAAQILLEVSALYMDIGKLPSAEKCIDKAATYSSERFVVGFYNNLGVKYAEQKQFNKAAQVLDKGLALAQSDEERKGFYQNYRWIAYQQKDKIMFDKYNKLLGGK